MNGNRLFRSPTDRDDATPGAFSEVAKHHRGGQDRAQRIGLALQRAEAVGEDVGVLRREDDEAALSQLGGVIVVGGIVAGDEVLGAAFEIYRESHPWLPERRLTAVGS